MDPSHRLAEVFVELADTLVDTFDVVDFLQVLTDRSVELLGADAAGLTLADERGDLQLMASTLERMRLIELFELQISQGPCRDCFDTATAVVNVELPDAAERWPQFTPAALEAGFTSTHALPMRLRGQVLGALNLFTNKASHMDAEQVGIGQAMADIATIGLLHERNAHEQVNLSEQLQSALHSRILIEQAKGVLAGRYGLEVSEAFSHMRYHARRTGVTLTVVAQSVIDGTIGADVLIPR
jgi:GAF domain-containing protein